MMAIGFLHGRKYGPVSLKDLPFALLVLFALIGLAGIMILASATTGQSEFAQLPQLNLVRLGLGLGLAMALAFLPLRIWALLAYPAWFAIMGMLALVPVFGIEGGGAARWLNLGAFSFQPSELMKIALPLALARHCAPDLQKYGRCQAASLSGALVLIALPVIMTARQPDLGTASMLAIIGAAIVLLAGMSRRLILLALLTLAVSVSGLYKFGLHDYQRQRIQTFLNPALDPLGAGYQLQQSKIAIGSGGFQGRGYGQGTQSQLEYIPEQHTDFIFTLIGEEFGFFGASLLLLAWAVTLWIGLRIAMRSLSPFGKLAAAGAALIPCMHVVVNVSMVTGLIPVVGMPLPMISHGGSAMLSVMAVLGLLMAVHVHRDETLASY